MTQRTRRRAAVRAGIAARRQDAESWLRELVAASSQAPHEAAAQELVAQLARSAGLDAALLDADPEGTLRTDPRHIDTGLGYSERPNCVVTIPGSRREPLICNAHIDTVAAGEGWTSRSSGELKDGLFYGLGACDAKASTVAALLAAATILRLGDEPNMPIELHSVIDEEPGGNGTLALARRAAAAGRRPPLVVVMEPSRLDVLTGHRGMLWYELDCTGVQGHGSGSTGVNAIEKAAGVTLALRSLNDRFLEGSSTAYDPPRVNVGMIRGGTEPYTTPGSCRLEMTARYAPGERDVVQRAVSAAIDAEPSDGEVRTLSLVDFDAAETPADDPAVMAALGAVRLHRPQAGLATLAGTCDLRHYRTVLGAPSVIFGPGDLAVAHAADEHVDIDEILVAAAALVELAFTTIPPAPSDERQREHQDRRSGVR